MRPLASTTTALFPIPGAPNTMILSRYTLPLSLSHSHAHTLFISRSLYESLCLSAAVYYSLFLLSVLFLFLCLFFFISLSFCFIFCIYNRSVYSNTLCFNVLIYTNSLFLFLTPSLHTSFLLRFRPGPSSWTSQLSNQFHWIDGRIRNSFAVAVTWSGQGRSTSIMSWTAGMIRG